MTLATLLAKLLKSPLAPMESTFLFKRSYLFVLMLVFLPFLASAQVFVKDMRSSHTSWRTRFVFDVSGPVKYSFFSLSEPDRLVVDIDDAKIADRFRKQIPANGLVNGLRFGQHGLHFLRVVFDLKHAIEPKAFTLAPMGGYGYRLVIDLFAEKPTTTKRVRPLPVLRASKPSAKITIVTAKPKKLRKIIIVIDPGHGGKDPGAIGLGGTREKNVVLKISKDLQHMINNEQGFKADLTRKGNYYIPLRGRLAIARKDHAEMFISVHADAFRNSRAAGASVFALSERGATSEAARWLANSENRSELSGGVELNDKDWTLRSVLINLAQTHTISTSLQMGNAIIQQLSKVTKLHHHRVEQAAFVVLKSPDIPSLLVETGFLSNPGEEKKLKTSRYQHRIAWAIMLGIKNYFIQHPPKGTYLAVRQARSRHS